MAAATGLGAGYEPLPGNVAPTWGAGGLAGGLAQAGGFRVTPLGHTSTSRQRLVPRKRRFNHSTPLAFASRTIYASEFFAPVSISPALPGNLAQATGRYLANG